MPPVSKTIPPEEVAEWPSPSAIRVEPSLLESPMRIHLILFLVARKALIATEQPCAAHAEHTNA